MRTEDGYIIQQCLDGDPTAFGLLVDKYKRSIYALAFSRIHNFHDAQDITQEAFIKAYQNLHTLRRWDNFIGWIYRITINICRDRLRSGSKRPDREYIEDQELGKMDSISMSLYSEDMVYSSIKESLESLPEIYCEVLTLRYFGGMKVNEMSRFLGVSKRTIDRRLNEAMSRLKEEVFAMIIKEQRELPSSFTFRIVEIVKHIKPNPISPLKALPFGIALAVGLIAGFLSMNTNLNTTTSIGTFTGNLADAKVLDMGEFPVDVVKVSSTPTIANQQNGDGVGSDMSSLQNALFMAPQVGDTWAKKADMPTARNNLSVSVVNGKIYAFGGLINGNADSSSAVEEYDPVTDTWTEKADMPTSRGSLATGVVNGKIYVIGGLHCLGNNNFKAVSTVEEYDPVLNKWTKKTDMPTARNSVCAATVDGKIYAIGGFRDGAGIEFSTVEEYDPAIDKWTRKKSMPTARQWFSTSVVDGKIYAIGGWRNGDSLSSVEEYDPENDKWKKKKDMLEPKLCQSTCAANGKIYAFGGWWGDGISTVEEYDPKNDVWTKKMDMLTARYFLGTALVNGKIYAIGGELNDGVSMSIVEEYDTGFGGESINLKGKLPTSWGETKTVLTRQD